MPISRYLVKLGRPRVLVVCALLATAALLSVATSTSLPRHRVPTHAFIDYCAATSHLAEVQLVNDTNRPVRATFLGASNQSRVVLPGSSVMVTLEPGRYAFELRTDKRVRQRRWLTFHPSRRYNYFHR